MTRASALVRRSSDAPIVDVISDPGNGQISDDPRTRFGRRHPLICFSALPAAASFLSLWYSPPPINRRPF
ncbi:MFS transporter [Qipengyuania mesophila]|uniref:MFS transporter n=1 Tax=Qipengyuania mesophila TaxID=2867246 RepID=UPI0031EB4E54